VRIGRWLCIIGIATGVPLIHVGWAQTGTAKSGTYWLRKCTSPEAYGPFECAGYVRALVEYDELRAELGDKRQYCPQKSATLGESRDAVLSYLREHPADGHLPFVSLAHTALKSAFPCPAGAQK
jgi:hypothetical protein